MESFSVETTAHEPKPLTQAFLFWTFRRRKNPPRPPTDWAIAGFATASLILWLVLDRLRYGGNVEFASWEVGRQKVFAEEIKLAAQRVGDRYGSSDRTLLLLNDRRGANSYPLATVSGLKLALKGIASRMNLDRDVLFLSLSSHGSAEPSLSVSNGNLPLKDLTGSDLAAALNESGIKWRVIVISACHAGAFINALQNDNTIILTAAAADRTSFGCSDNRDLTYFGEAFYRDAFPKSATLRQAFDRAVADIASREQREGIEPPPSAGLLRSRHGPETGADRVAKSATAATLIAADLCQNRQHFCPLH